MHANRSRVRGRVVYRAVPCLAEFAEDFMRCDTSYHSVVIMRRRNPTYHLNNMFAAEKRKYERGQSGVSRLGDELF
jgi:hypothetical protein